MKTQLWEKSKLIKIFNTYKRIKGISNEILSCL